MSKRSYLFRYSLILNKLAAKPYSTYEELKSYIENQVEFRRSIDDTLEMGFSKRTLQRDIREIRNMWGYHIEYSRSEGGYFFVDSSLGNTNFQRMIEAFDLFNSLNISQDLMYFIHLEKRKPQGTENLYGLIHAIKNRHKINFSYQKFWEDDATKRVAEPYALKEFKDRWYLLAKDNKDSKIKTFALDRLSTLKVTSEKFKRSEYYNVHENYRHYFGIITPEGAEPLDIILSFDPVQGKYIKTLPIHETQKILIDNEEEVKVKLRLCVTQDFIMELLSFGNRMKVIKPLSLAKRIKEAHYNAYTQYK